MHERSEVVGRAVLAQAVAMGDQDIVRFLGADLLLHQHVEDATDRAVGYTGASHLVGAPWDAKDGVDARLHLDGGAVGGLRGQGCREQGRTEGHKSESHGIS